MERDIEARTHVEVDRGTIGAILERDPQLVFSGQATHHGLARRTFDSFVTAPAGGDTVLRHAVVVDLGPPRVNGGAIISTIRWEPSGGRHVLPSFDGDLVAVAEAGGGSQLTLRGNYEIPFGVAGRFGDALIGRRIARQSLSELVDRLGRAIEQASTQFPAFPASPANETDDRAARSPNDRPARPSEPAASENYIG